MATDTVNKAENFTLQNGEEDVICPSCDAKIKRSQVADHCQVEMERLHSMQLRSTASTAAPATTSTTQAAVGEGPGGGGAGGQRKPWSVFQRVQRNRQARQRQRTRKRATSPQPPSLPPPPPPPPTPPATSTAPSQSCPSAQTSICPVCNGSFPRAQIQEHANACLRINGQNGQQNGHTSDEDGDSEEYEEYEWAGQKRIRVSTLVQGGYSALNLGQTSKYHNGQQATEDEDDVNVDEDDTHIYGPTQYGEADVIPLNNEEASGEEGGAGGAADGSDVTMYVRRLISANDIPKSNQHSSATTEELMEQQEQDDYDEDDDAAAAASLAPSTSQASRLNNCKSNTRSHQSQQQQIIESLKSRLRLYEKQAQTKLKCLICIDDYKNPAISVSCWHVHCEQCWLQTLGARKLCPQCNSITTPKDLRRIYL